MRSLPKSALPAPAAPTATRQLSIAFDSIGLRGINPSERAKALTQADLSMQATGIVTGGARVTSVDLLPTTVLKRKALVYVR
jgi:hypothetical protein